jgi:hypothetical protein
LKKRLCLPMILEIVAGTLSRSWSVFAGVTALAVVALVFSLGSADPAAASKNCGSFHVSGLKSRVHVTVTKGSVPCRRAKHVMKRLFNGRNTSPYKCVGPQTGYAACHHHRNRIQAHF